MSNIIKKVLAYRALSFVVGFAVTYMWWGIWQQSFLFTVVLLSTMTIVHYLFEKWWDRNKKFPEWE